MILKIEAKKSLYVNEWRIIITNDFDYDIIVDLGHTELMVKTITIKEGTEVPDVFKQEG